MEFVSGRHFDMLSKKKRITTSSTVFAGADIIRPLEAR